MTSKDIAASYPKFILGALASGIAVWPKPKRSIDSQETIVDPVFLAYIQDIKENAGKAIVAAAIADAYVDKIITANEALALKQAI